MEEIYQHGWHFKHWWVFQIVGQTPFSLLLTSSSCHVDLGPKNHMTFDTALTFGSNHEKIKSLSSSCFNWQTFKDKWLWCTYYSLDDKLFSFFRVQYSFLRYLYIWRVIWLSIHLTFRWPYSLHITGHKSNVIIFKIFKVIWYIFKIICYHHSYYPVMTIMSSKSSHMIHIILRYDDQKV